MRYECQRCKATLFTTDGEHICKDLKARYNRQKKAVDKIKGLLLGYRNDDGIIIRYDDLDDVALEIVRAISGLNLEDT